MTSSTESVTPHALRALTAEKLELLPLATPELRDGDWTRYAGGGALGDQVTEQTLGALADRALEAARARGYATGWAQGRQQAAAEAREAACETALEAAGAETRRRAEHDAALQALAQAARGFQDGAAEVAARLEDRCLDLALELTEALLGHQLRTSPDPVADLARRVLAVLPTGVPTIVRVHATRVAELRPLLGATGTSVIDDATLGPHDAVVETAESVIDLAVDAALDRVREALS